MQNASYGVDAAAAVEDDPHVERGSRSYALVASFGRAVNKGGYDRKCESRPLVTIERAVSSPA